LRIIPLKSNPMADGGKGENAFEKKKKKGGGKKDQRTITGRAGTQNGQQCFPKLV